MTKSLGEFDQISQFMAPLAAQAEGAFALKDDAAAFHIPEGHEAIITTDTLIEGVHFLPNDPADTIAVKALGVNLSDLAAMGAKPLHYTLNASYPAHISTEWLESFAAGLKEMQDEHGIVLIGGDTTRTTGPLTLSITAIGTTKRGKALRRHGAQPGDLICISGTLGDGALGLKVALGDLSDATGLLLDRYRKPQPRCTLGPALNGIARTCMDISDGLIADLGHKNIDADIRADSLQVFVLLDREPEFHYQRARRRLLWSW